MQDKIDKLSEEHDQLKGRVTALEHQAKSQGESLNRIEHNQSNQTIILKELSTKLSDFSSTQTAKTAINESSQASQREILELKLGHTEMKIKYLEAQLEGLKISLWKVVIAIIGSGGAGAMITKVVEALQP